MADAFWAPYDQEIDGVNNLDEDYSDMSYEEDGRMLGSDSDMSSEEDCRMLDSDISSGVEEEGYVLHPDVEEGEGHNEMSQSDSEEADEENDFILNSDSEEEDEVELTPDEKFLEDLSEFCLTFLPDYGTDRLLKLLRDNKRLVNIPKTHKELLGDLSDIPKPMEVKGGHSLHLGIRSNLKLYPQCNFPNPLLFDFSYDGVSLFKSSSNSFWPIVMSHPNLPEVGVRLVSVFYGTKAEVDLNEFFACFITEVNEIIEQDNGMVEVGPKKEKVAFSFHLCVSDTPAKSFALGIIGHAGYWACPNCHQTGTHVRSRMAYDPVPARLRTNEEFRRFADENHHIKRTPLVDLACGVDMVMDFPGDAMHAIDSGVIRLVIFRLLKLNMIQESEADALIEKVKPLMPSEFPRKIRLLKYRQKFKATEFKFYGLYFGALFFIKCVQSQEVQDHFMLLFVAYRLLMGDGKTVAEADVNQAEIYLQQFVRDFPQIYGGEYVGFNVHMLLHFPAYVRRFGPLSKFSCYQYENFYMLLSRWVRKPSNVFVQVSRRWVQTSGSVRLKPKTNSTFDTIHISGNKKDSYLMLNDGSIFSVRSKNDTVEGTFFMGKVYQSQSSFFTYPMNSELLNIYKVSQLSGETITISPSDIKHKMVALPFNDNELVVLPLIHC